VDHFRVFIGRINMKGIKPCKQDNEHIHKLRQVHERKFSEYLQQQRRKNPRYYGIKCHLKIDFIVFTVYLGEKKKGKPDERQLQPLRNDLMRRRKRSPKYTRNDAHIYNRSVTYKFQYMNQEYELNIACASRTKFRPYLIKIHDPTCEVLEYLQHYLNQITYYHIQSVEFVYDFYSEDNDLVRNFIKRHVIVSWRGKEYHPEYEKTFYGNNIRFATGKGLRSYEKEETVDRQEMNFVRMEMLLKRPILKNNGIHSIDDLTNMDTRIPNKYFKYKAYNYNILEKRVKNTPDDLIKLRALKRSINDEIEKGYLYEMNKYSLQWCKCYPSDTYLKKIKYWDHFVYQFGCYSFLNGDSFPLSLGLMEDEF
jgi:hypothetical protein